MSWFRSNGWMNSVHMFIEYTIDRRVNRPGHVSQWYTLIYICYWEDIILCRNEKKLGNLRLEFLRLQSKQRRRFIR